MFNIEYKGKLRGDIDQISSGKALPEGSVQFREPESVDKAFALGAAFVIPTALILAVLALVRMLAVYPKPEGGLTGEMVKSVFPPLIVCLLLLWPFTYIHEIIHALLFPKELKKQIYVHPESMSLFVYCEETVSKIRFIVVSVGPAVILGIVPYITTMIIVPAIPARIAVALIVFSVMEYAAALGDFVNVYNCIRQVPKDAKVFNRGYHSYWIK